MTSTAPEIEKLRPRRPWSRLDVRKVDPSRLTSLKMPDVKLPDVRLPDVTLPDVSLPDIKRPEMKLPNVKLPDRLDIPGGFEIRRRSALRLPMAVVIGVAGLLGAAATFLLDPRVGASRRAYTRDRLTGLGRKLGRQARHTARWLASDAVGLAERLRNAGDAPESLDEVELAHKVETELFRDQTIDKGHLSINAERDVVFLRGVAPTPEAIADIEGRVSRIDGVRHVVNLLHLPGTRAPNEPFGEPAPARPA